MKPVVLILLLAAVLTAQTVDDNDDEELVKSVTVPVDLLDREPFFELTLDAQNGNAVLEILPLESVPTSPKSTDRLRVRLLDEPDQEYEVLWQHVAKLRTYNQLVFDEGVRLTRQKDYNGAFRYFDYVLKNSTSTPALQISVLEYLLENADALLAEQKTDHAMAILEEILQRDPDFRREQVDGRLTQVADALIQQEVARGDYAQARAVMRRLEGRYGPDRMRSLPRWQRQFVDEATDILREAEGRAAELAWREAEQLTRRVEAIWPELPGAAELRQEVARQYPMVIVGVAEAAASQDPTSLANWPGRRTGRLTLRTLLEFRGAGPEGGQYLCPFGDHFQSEDRRRLTLVLDAVGFDEQPAALDGYAVARQVREMADPASPSYRASWAALAASVRVQDVFTVHMDLRRPHVLPEALLQIRLDPLASPPSGPVPGEGPFQLQESDDGDVHFVVNPRHMFAVTDHPREIVERYFETSDEAVAALRRGDVDAVDFVLPDDAARLADTPGLRVVPYALPTLHVLIPNHHRLFMANARFRRALVYGIDRQAILDTEILGNRQVAGCRVISGPFPIGTRDNDPLAYAYDARVAPRSYQPRLATILKTLARRELQEAGAKRGVELPPETQIVLGHPPHQVARITCQAIRHYLQVIGIDCQLRELPPGAGREMTDDLDLIYVQVAMWEPVIDARRLLAPDGAGDATNPYVGMALRRLDAARNWREARERLHDVHRIVAEQVAIIPLWQTVNHLAHGDRVVGVGSSPLTLYDDVEQWQVVTLPRQE